MMSVGVKSFGPLLVILDVIISFVNKWRHKIFTFSSKWEHLLLMLLAHYLGKNTVKKIY